MWVMDLSRVFIRESNGLLICPLVLGGRPESWTFCTTFKYVFLDFEDCLAEVPLTITLISPSRGRDGSSTFPFKLLSL